MMTITGFAGFHVNPAGHVPMPTAGVSASRLLSAPLVQLALRSWVVVVRVTHLPIVWLIGTEPQLVGEYSRRPQCRNHVAAGRIVLFRGLLRPEQLHPGCRHLAAPAQVAERRQHLQRQGRVVRMDAVAKRAATLTRCAPVPAGPARVPDGVCTGQRWAAAGGCLAKRRPLVVGKFSEWICSSLPVETGWMRSI